MKIANVSVDNWWRLSRRPALKAPGQCSPDVACEPSFARVVSLIAIGGVLLTPWAAQAQGDATAAPAGDKPDSAKTPPAAEGSAQDEESAPDPGLGAPEEESAPDPGAATAAEAAPKEMPTQNEPAAPDIERDSIVVTGYRKSLKAALSLKKKSTEQIDAIVAEDMAEFPDLNLAESLQRMPGIAITRVEGEGSQITVRGLGSRYTRTRVNGMDARAAVRGNATRSFDFNMFASELFNSVVVHKTATAELGEGALGAVVDLNTARAFDYDKGFTFLVGAQGGYNDLSQAFFPRVTGLVSYHDPKGIWGATASIAYSKTRLDVESSDTVRWAKSGFRSVNGVACAANPTDPGCAQVADSFHPRIPRYAYSRMEGERVGVTAGLQFRPTKRLEIKLDALYAIYNTQQDFHPLELLFRGNENKMDITGYQIQQNPSRFGAGNNTLLGASVNNAWLRSEATRQIVKNDFKQVTLSADLEVTDDIYVTALGGISRSGSSMPHETTLMYDNRAYNGYSYDYSNSQFPSLSFGGPDVTSPSTYTLTELRDVVKQVDVGYEVADLGVNWQALKELKLSVGGSYKAERMSLNTKNRNGAACRPGLFNCDTNGDGTNDILGPTGTGANSDLVNYPGKVGAGSNTQWAAPNIDRWNSQLGFYNVPLVNDVTNIRNVQERSLAAYLQASGEVPVASMRLAYNAGVRYVQTRQTSGGYVSTDWIEVVRDPYNDILPSANAALWLTDALVARVAGARVMSRPALADLSPGATVSGFNFEIDQKNPYLEPTRAWAGDLGLEWYFAPESIVSVAGFVKKIDSFPETRSETGTFASTGYSTDILEPTSPAGMNPEGTCGVPAGCWQISKLINGGGATVAGVELGFAAPFNAFSKKLPIVIRSMGFTGNYTYIHSRFPWDFLGTEVQERLEGLSTHAANATLYYDDTRFSIRASLAWRSQYINMSDANQNGNLFSYEEPPPRLDMSSGFKVTKNLQITAEAINLTNSPSYTLVDIDARRPQTYGISGRTFFLGARFSFKTASNEQPAKP